MIHEQSRLGMEAEMACAQPVRISIGMPVYNGEKYVREALESILAQTHPDFELIISDNASTDRTGEICRAYAARDRRIRYYRNKKNLGIARNFNRVFELSTGEYFKWASHDDRIEPEFLARCLAALDRDPELVLCEARCKTMDASGNIIGELPLHPAKLGSPHRHVRLGYLLRTDRTAAGEYFGLMRSSVLRQSGLMRNYPGGENPMRIELGLRGRIAVVPECLFCFRQHSEQYYERHHALHVDVEWSDGAQAGKRLYPHWRRLRDYCRVVQHVPMPTRERILCNLQVACWVLASLNWTRLLMDPVWVFLPGLWGPYYRLKRWFLRKAEHDRSVVGSDTRR
jgi:glycosyltransferase involved in cell wall biosynthesis